MTEAEWLSTSDGAALYELAGTSPLSYPHQQRLARLLCCACCRMLDLPEPARELVSRLEIDADGVVHDRDSLAIPVGLDRKLTALLGRAGERAVTRCMWITGVALGFANMDFTPHVPLIRCIYGNPFRPLEGIVPIAIATLATTCAARLPAISESLAVLGDALEELGQLDAAAHCREPIHHRGCHVIDWALGTRSLQLPIR